MMINFDKLVKNLEEDYTDELGNIDMHISVFEFISEEISEDDNATAIDLNKLIEKLKEYTDELDNVYMNISAFECIAEEIKEEGGEDRD